MIAEFIQPADPRWWTVLKHAQHDIYHLPSYTRLAARYEGGTPVAFYAETDRAKFLAPLLLRDIPPALGAPAGWQDAVSPYGYPTPLVAPADDTESLGLFLEALRVAGAERQLVTAFFRLHPLITLPQCTLAKHGQLVRHGETVWIDLTLSTEDLWANTRENHRRDIRKLKKAGFKAEVNRWDLLRSFITIYRQTMDRHQADEFYFFSDDYFTEARRRFGGCCLHLCTVCAPDGTLAAAGLFTTVNDIMEYHLGGTNADYLHCAPSKLLFDHMRTWAKETGLRSFHLGGGLGSRDDSLFRFKAGFSKMTSDFYTYRMVLDGEKYAFLTQQAAEPVEDSLFFPAYRRSK